jgi:DNA helicase HerA-like ATPase
MSRDPADLRSRLDRFRALQTSIEDVILALASSLDGRTFSFQAPFTTTSFFPGRYVTLERDGAPPLLAQVLAARVDRVRAGSVEGLEVGDDASMQVTGDVAVRVLAGEGVILCEVAEGAVAPPPAGQAFRDAVLRLASADEIRRYLETAGAGGAALEIGRALLDEEVPVFLDASGFNRHTFLCGQSGSGKTYALGIVVERLLIETDLRVILLDPNSDFVRLNDLHPDVDANGGPGRRFQDAAGRVRVLRADGPDSGLRLRFSDLDPAAQARVLQLDPLEHREEYDLYQRTVEELGRAEYSLADVADRLLGDESEEARLLALRLRNLGIAEWELWSGAGRSLLDELDGGGWQCLVLDVGGLELPAERAVVAEAVLAHLWRERRRREPVLVVVDEAHNVCPQEPEDAVTALATELAVLIAGEGRKFGLYLLVASQRPAKIHANVLSQCENLVLMRMNSLGDLDHVRTVFSHTPPTLVEQSSTFRLGESLLAGRIVPNPTFARFSGRLSLEGGGDVATSWAAKPT